MPKIRVWDGEKMIYPAAPIYLAIGADSWGLWDKNEGDEILMAHSADCKSKLMFSVGLQDRNGRYIYRGDIVKDKSSGNLMRVTWEEKGAFFICKPVEAPENWNPFKYVECVEDMMLPNFEGYLTIKGNVFENPELIKED